MSQEVEYVVHLTRDDQTLLASIARARGLDEQELLDAIVRQRLREILEGSLPDLFPVRSVT